MNSNNMIYVCEPDRRLADNLMRTLARTFPDRRVFRFHSNRELMDALRKRRPCVLLQACGHEEGDVGLRDVISNVANNPLDQSISVILMGTRLELEANYQLVLDNELLTIPKAIRMPVLLDMVDGCFSRADLRKISFVQLMPGDYLFRQGDVADSIFVVKQGVMAILMVQNKQEVLLKEIGEHEMIGEMAFVDNAPRSANVKAVTRAELVKLELGDFKEYLDKQSIWVKLIIQTLNERLRESNKRMFTKK